MPPLRFFLSPLFPDFRFARHATCMLRLHNAAIFVARFSSPFDAYVRHDCATPDVAIRFRC